MHHGAPSPVAPPKKANQGCFIALAAFGGLAIVGFLALAVGVYRLMKDPTAQKMVKAVEETAKVAEEGRKAPGAREVRKAGCQDAMVLDPAKLAQVMETMFDAGVGGAPGEASADGPVHVICQVGALGQAPECDALARVYVAAAHPTEAFSVSVQKQGTSKAVCAFLYSSSGARTEDLR